MGDSSRSSLTKRLIAVTAARGLSACRTHGTFLTGNKSCLLLAVLLSRSVPAGSSLAGQFSKYPQGIRRRVVGFADFRSHCSLRLSSKVPCPSSPTPDSAAVTRQPEGYKVPSLRANVGAFPLGGGSGNSTWGLSSQVCDETGCSSEMEETWKD